MIGYILLVLLALSVAGYFYGRNRAWAVVQGRERELHSRPNYHGAYVAAYVGIPSILLVLIWLFLQGIVIDQLLLASLPPGTLDGLDKGQISLLLSQIKSLAGGNAFTEPTLTISAAAERYAHWQTIARYAMIVAVLSVALAALYLTTQRISPQFRARHATERVLSGLMMA